jgi:thymidylate kinase
MIIIEGVDKSGKTTLAKKLSEEFKIPIKKFGIPTGDPIPSYIEELGKNNLYIYDRFLYGEIPYSIVKHRTRYMKYLELRVLDLMVQTHSHLVIYVRPTRDTIDKRLARLGDDYIDRIEATQLYEEYDEMFSDITSNLMTFRGDQDYETISNFIKKIVLGDTFRKVQSELWLKFNHPGIGNILPKYLFIGDRYNYNAPYQITFCSTSGEYLFRALDAAKFPMGDCHFTNAFNAGDIISENLINHLNPNTIICLGDIPYAILSKFNLKAEKIVKVFHPSYWKRFHAGEEDQYVSTLKEYL